jgi:hypothetical protein
MAKDYVSIYRQLLRMRASDTKMQSTWARQLRVNGGNGLTPVSIEKPLPVLVEANAIPDAPF